MTTSVEPRTDLAFTAGAASQRLVLRVAQLLAWLVHGRSLLRFRRRVGYWPNAARPRRYNEMMLWRKLFDHNPRFIVFSDKLATRALQARLCPDLALPELLWVGEDAARIPPAALLRPAVIKASHGCDYNHFRRRGAGDRALKPRQVRRLNAWLRRTYGRPQGEWAYRFVAPKLFVEALVTPDPGDELLDLSVHVVGGAPLFLEAIVRNKTAAQRKGYFHCDGTRWPELEPRRREADRKPALPADFTLPACRAEALVHAARLGAGVDYARVDFLVASGRLHGGEIAVYPGSGLTRHSEFAAYNDLLASRWDLTTSWFLTTPQPGLRGVYARALAALLRRDGPGA